MNLYNFDHSYVQSISCHEDMLVHPFISIYWSAVYLSTYPFICVFTSVHISMLR
jgi:hypothetical protein